MRKIFLWVLLALFAVAGSADAKNKFQGDATDGATGVLGSLLGTKTNVVKTCPGAQMYVYTAGTTSLATVYSTDSGTAKANPFTIPNSGRYFFFADLTSYDLRITGGGCADHTWLGISVGGSSSSRSISAKDAPYLAVGDGVNDDTAELQAAIDAASALSAKLIIPKGIYLISSELQIAGKPIVIEGVPHDFWTDETTGTRIKATSAMRSVLAVLSPRHTISHLAINANQLANYGVFLHLSAVSTFDNIYSYSAKLDGWYNSPASGTNNNFSFFNRCYAYNNGKTYGSAGAKAGIVYLDSAITTAGTAASTAGNGTVTFTGAPDLTTLHSPPIRKGDLLLLGSSVATASLHLIGGNAYTLASLTSSGTTATGTTSAAHAIATGQMVTVSAATPSTYNGSFVVTGVPTATTFTYTLPSTATSPATGTVHVDHTTITATTVGLQGNYYNLPQTTASGLDWAIGVGSGWRDNFNGNGCCNTFTDFISYGNGSSGMAISAVYGQTILGGDVSYNGIAGVVFGVSNNTGTVFSNTMSNLYCEDVTVCYVLGGGSTVITNPVGTSFETTSPIFAYGHPGVGQDTQFIYGGKTYNWVRGEEQNFVVQVRNNAGVTEHRIVSEFVTGAGFGSSTATANRITGASSTYAATPLVTAAVGFTNGVGILNGSAESLILNVARTMPDQPSFTATIEGNTTGTAYTTSIAVLANTNINGVTRTWVRLFLLNATTGALVNWNALPAGTYVAVRVKGLIR